MRCRLLTLGLSALMAGAFLMPGAAQAGTGGGVSATPGTTQSGGSGGTSGGDTAGGISSGKTFTPRHSLMATAFTLATGTVTAGAAVPRLTIQVTQPDVRRVRAYVLITPPRGHGSPARVELGSIFTGKRFTIALPAKRTPALAAGSYTLRLSAVSGQGQTLKRTKRSPGRVVLRVKAKPKPTKAPAVVTPTPGGKSPSPSTKTPSSGSSVRFPVAGSHTFGGSGSRFGVGRVGHTHQGQDVAADTGTPVVAPTAGQITVTGYQAAAAGEWVAMHSTDGRDFFFAHCVRRSTAVSEGQSVRAGTHLCDVGSTGDASGPHLHFEIWIDGWRASSASHPIDPLPQLKRWQAADPRF